MDNSGPTHAAPASHGMWEHGDNNVKIRLLLAAGAFALLASSISAQAQGIIGGGEHGARVGNRAAGPVGAVVGGVVGGVTGGVVGGVRGVVGVPHRGYYRRHHRHHRYYR